MCIYSMYVYIYIYRERERERKRRWGAVRSGSRSGGAGARPGKFHIITQLISYVTHCLLYVI